MPMQIKNNLKKEAALEIFRILSKSSDENIIRFAAMAEKLASPNYKPMMGAVRDMYEKRGPALILTKRIISGVDKRCQEKFLENFVLPELLGRLDKREKLLVQGSAALFTLLISPSMRCTLHCKGCYAENYKKEDDLPFDVLDRVVSEAEEMGAAYFTILGGEPFIREDLFDLYKKHPDSYFVPYTNGTVITDGIAKKLLEVGNVMPQFSVEGFEEDTDFRRGKGTYQKAMRAMDILRENKVPFGYSVCVTRKNAKTVMSDEFVDLMIKKGALLGWYFLYMPVCGDKNTELMPTPEQRNEQRLRRDYLRANKPLFIIDFWNDAPYVGGCIAAKHYSHVTNFGDVEPCIFTHFAQANIKNVSLKEAMDCEFFKEIRKRQPYVPNLLTPCMLIDNPQVSRELCQTCKVRSTHPGARTLMNELKGDIDKYSSQVHQIFDKIWDDEHKKQQ